MSSFEKAKGVGHHFSLPQSEGTEKPISYASTTNSLGFNHKLKLDVFGKLKLYPPT